jgi:hypothetical protein
MINQLTIDLIKIKKFINRFETGRLRLIDNIGNVYSKNNNFFYKFVMSNVLKDSPLRSFFMDWLVESEKRFPNSSKELLKNLYSLHVNQKINKSLKKKEYSTREDLNEILNDYIDSESIQIFNLVLDISGPDALLNIFKTDNIKIEIKKENLTKFDKIYCHEELNSILFSQNQKSKRDIIFVAIDGFLERDTDLQHAYIESQMNQNKMIVVLCRGTNLQCIQQIKRNLVYNKVPVLIYECPFINEDPMKFDDLCKCLKVSAVKLEEGDPTIIQIKNKLVKLENIMLSSDSIEFECDIDNSTRMISEINDLLLTQKEEYKEYLNLRKKRIKSKKVNIFIPKNKKNLISDLNTAIFVYNSITRYGILYKNEKKYALALLKNSEILATEFYEKLKNISTIINLNSKKGKKNGKDKKFN